MLELLLLRHAKSRWDEPGGDDHRRDLAPRGLMAARRMGELLRELDLAPDLVLCSTARRAEHTWEIATAELGASVPVRLDERLYLAAPDRMIEVVRELGGDARRLMLVGHDPGMHQLARKLAAGGDGSSRLAAKFPTGALAQFKIAGDGWDAFTGEPAELLGFWRPRDVGVAGD